MLLHISGRIKLHKIIKTITNFNLIKLKININFPVSNSCIYQLITLKIYIHIFNLFGYTVLYTVKLVYLN